MCPVPPPGQRGELLNAADKTASGHLPAKGIGEHSARGRYVGQIVPTETTRHNADLQGPASKDRDHHTRHEHE